MAVGRGRPKGSPNKVTADLRARLKEILETEMDNGRVEAAMQELYEQDKHKYMVIYEKLVSRVVPITQEVQVEAGTIDIEATIASMKKELATEDTSESDS